MQKDWRQTERENKKWEHKKKGKEKKISSMYRLHYYLTYQQELNYFHNSKRILLYILI